MIGNISLQSCMTSGGHEKHVKTYVKHRFQEVSKPSNRVILATRIRIHTFHEISPTPACRPCWFWGLRPNRCQIPVPHIITSQSYAWARYFWNFVSECMKICVDSRLAKSRGFIYVERHFSPSNLIPGFGPSHVSPKPLQLLQFMVNARSLIC